MITLPLDTPAAAAIASITRLLAIPEILSMSQVMFSRVNLTLIRLVYVQTNPARHLQSRSVNVWPVDELVLRGHVLQLGVRP